MADNKTHECLRVLQEKWERPVFQPILFNLGKEGSLTHTENRWAIKMFNLTKSGAMSGVGQGTLIIEYCPMCGEKLTPEDDK